MPGVTFRDGDRVALYARGRPVLHGFVDAVRDGDHMLVAVDGQVHMFVRSTEDRWFNDYGGVAREVLPDGKFMPDPCTHRIPGRIEFWKAAAWRVEPGTGAVSVEDLAKAPPLDEVFDRVPGAVVGQSRADAAAAAARFGHAIPPPPIGVARDVPLPVEPSAAELEGVIRNAFAAPSGPRKYDGGKLRYDLVDAHALAWLAGVLTYGAVKYAPDNWRGFAPEVVREKFYGAAMRHLEAWRAGEDTDPESGLPTLAGALFSVMVLVATFAPRDPREVVARTRAAIRQWLANQGVST